MCIGHGIRVAARAFVTFVKGRLKCLLLLLLLKHTEKKPIYEHVSSDSPTDGIKKLEYSV